MSHHSLPTVRMMERGGNAAVECREEERMGATELKKKKKKKENHRKEKKKKKELKIIPACMESFSMTPRHPGRENDNK